MASEFPSSEILFLSHAFALSPGPLQGPPLEGVGSPRLPPLGLAPPGCRERRAGSPVWLRLAPWLWLARFSLGSRLDFGLILGLQLGFGLGFYQDCIRIS